MTRRQWIAVVVAAVLVAAALPTGYVLLERRREAADRTAQRAAAGAFARAWVAGTLGSLTYAGGSAAAVADDVARVTAGLTPARRDAPTTVAVVGVGRAAASAVPVTLDVTWTLARGTPWRYRTALDLVESGGDWRPRFAPSVVHPDLRPGDRLRTSSTPAARGQITGAGDAVLVSERPVVVVGLTPNRVRDVDASAGAVAAVTGVDAAALAKRVRAAAPTTFVEAITLREEAYQEVRDRLRPIPGTTFVRGTRSLAPTATFARALLGTVGPATAETVEESKGRVRAGDTTGLSGLQRAYDEQLSGTPGVTVRRVLATPPGGVDAEAPTRDLLTREPVPGTPLRTTLDRDVQYAADAALATAPKPAALVAVRVGTGEVLAVANGGPNATGYDRALLGRYPPGSTFKVVSTLALLESGLTADTPVDCPATISVSGKRFRNAEDEVLGRVPFRTDFADSCNTAFVGSADRVDAAELSAAARALGFGAENRLGIEAFTGSVPETDDPVGHAAAMIGQGTVLASPVTVAGASAAVAAGAWRAPRLVLDGPTGDDARADDPGRPLPAGAARELRSLMREVVTRGTGVGVRRVPGPPVHGKTGTAEYGDADPPRTHAWFTGFQGDVAFAVVVEDGGFGADTAVPLAARFLTRLQR